MFPSPTKRNLTDSNFASRQACSPSRCDVDDETATKLANLGRRARQSVSMGYQSPSHSPVHASSCYSAYPSSPSTTPTKARPGLAHAYSSGQNSPAGSGGGGFVTDREARVLASQQAPGVGSSPGGNPFLVSGSAAGLPMDLDGGGGGGACASSGTTAPRNPSPLKRTSRARSRSPSPSSSPFSSSSGTGGQLSARPIRALPSLRGTKSLPAPPAPPLFSPFGAAQQQGEEDAMGGVEEMPTAQQALSGAGSWTAGEVSEWARSEDF